MDINAKSPFGKNQKGLGWLEFPKPCVIPQSSWEMAQGLKSGVFLT
nr:hypothetical protein [uncultured Campylobacter sp.]